MENVGAENRAVSTKVLVGRRRGPGEKLFYWLKFNHQRLIFNHSRAPCDGKDERDGRIEADLTNLFDSVLAAEIFHALWVDLEDGCCGGFLAGGAAQGSAEVSDLDFFHFGIEIDSAFRNEDGFLAGGAVLEHVLGEMLGGDLRCVHHDDEALDDVFEFADVAGPTVVLEDFENIGFQRLQAAF